MITVTFEIARNIPEGESAHSLKDAANLAEIDHLLTLTWKNDNPPHTVLATLKGPPLSKRKQNSASNNISHPNIKRYLVLAPRF